MEVWKNIKGYEGLYQISNLGRVKALEKVKNYTVNGKQRKSILKEKILKPVYNYGYCRVILWKDNVIKNYRIHRLVAEHFIDNPHNKLEVNHINADKKDNRVENLEWATSQENQQHAFNNGLNSRKLKTNEALDVLNSNQKALDLSIKYNVSISTIRCIKKRESYKYLNDL